MISHENSHITYKDLLEISSWGLFSLKIKGTSICDKRLEKYKKKSIKDAEYGGIYIGSPGRDIYYMLPYLSEEQFEEVANIIVDRFPKDPPGNHVNVGMFFRQVYGQFEKQGVLRSDKDLKRMKKEKLDWNLSKKFIELLHDKFEKNNNFYGLSILYEMEAHRVGDKAILNMDIDMMDKMEKFYLESVRYSHKCNSYKQMFTPYYWCFEYFKKYGTKKKALLYAHLTIEAADKHCPDARPGYVTKLSSCIKYIRKKNKDKWNSFYKTYKNSKNKCVKKTFKEYKI